METPYILAIIGGFAVCTMGSFQGLKAPEGAAYSDSSQSNRWERIGTDTTVQPASSGLCINGACTTASAPTAPPSTVSAPATVGSAYPAPESRFSNMSDQEIANQIGQGMSLQRVPTITYGCEYWDPYRKELHNDFAGINIPADKAGGGKITLCKEGIHSFEEKIQVIAHELGHSRAYEGGLPSTEIQADTNGIDYLASQNMWDAVKVKADAHYTNGDKYLPGVRYAQEKLAQRNQNGQSN